MTPLQPAELADLELFAGLPEEQLRWIASMGRRRVLTDGTVLFREGQPPTGFYLLLDGELLFRGRRPDGEHVLTRHMRHRGDPTSAADKPGADQDGKPAAAHHFTGELPLLTGSTCVATAVACGETEVAEYSKTSFFEMIARCPQVCTVLLPALAWRIRSVEAQASRRATVEALGTMAAGLAHELNNPAAALSRAATELAAMLPDLLAAAVEWGGAVAGPDRRFLADTVRDLRSRPRGPRDVLTEAERADELADLLADAGVPQPDQVADELAELGAGTPELVAIAARLRTPGLAMLIRSLSAHDLVDQVVDAGHRISALVETARTYSDLDRAPRRDDVDVVAGIEASLAMFGPRLAAVRIRRGYSPELPRITAYPSELNQVWSNLIDNALDALSPDGGELSIDVGREADHLIINITDTGCGIPDDIQRRIFQPFFTTKDVGRGTGLGLYAVHDIVTRRHAGSLDVLSRPGYTCFEIRLPVRHA